MSKKGEAIYKKWDKAIKDIDLDAISNLIKESPKLINQGIIHYRENGTIYQTLPLNMVNNSLEATKLLIENGADPNEHGEGNVLALHNASAEVTKYLISIGADVSLVGYEECSPLMYEVYMQNYENVNILIVNGADVNYQSQYDGYTSLHWASRKGDIVLVKTLLQNGANPKTLNRENQSALDLAESNNHDDVYDYLKNVISNE